MIHGGLVSVTFRQLSCEEIVALVSKAQLAGIEWGGDVHVPHGEGTRAREVRRRTVDAGLDVPSYGSYYRPGQEHPPPSEASFEAALESAGALQAPIIRVWAGRRGSADADEAYWRRVVEDSLRIAELAQQAGLTIAYEYHDNTLTDTNASALRLLQEVDQGRIDAQTVLVEELRGLSVHEDEEIDTLVQKHWGKITRGTPEEKLADIRRFNNDLRAFQRESH